MPNASNTLLNDRVSSYHSTQLLKTLLIMLPLENGLNDRGTLGSAVLGDLGGSLLVGVLSTFAASFELEDFEGIGTVFVTFGSARPSQSIGSMLKSCAALRFADSGVAHLSEVLGMDTVRRGNGPSAGLLALNNDRCCCGG